MLLAPIVAEIYCVDVEGHGLAHLGDIIIGNMAQQITHKSRMLEKIHHQIFHAAQGPGAFVQRKTDLEDAKAVGKTIDLVWYILIKPGLQRVRPDIPLQRGLLQLGPSDQADILVHAAVPDHAKDIANQIFVQVCKKAHAIAQFQKMVVENGLDIRAVKMGLQFFLCFDGKRKRPGYIGWCFTVQQHFNDLAFGHASSPLLSCRNLLFISAE